MLELRVVLCGTRQRRKRDSRLGIEAETEVGSKEQIETAVEQIVAEMVTGGADRGRGGADRGHLEQIRAEMVTGEAR